MIDKIGGREGGNKAKSAICQTGSLTMRTMRERGWEGERGV